MAMGVDELHDLFIPEDGILVTPGTSELRKCKFMGWGEGVKIIEM